MLTFDESKLSLPALVSPDKIDCLVPKMMNIKYTSRSKTLCSTGCFHSADADPTEDGTEEKEREEEQEKGEKLDYISTVIVHRRPSLASFVA